MDKFITADLHLDHTNIIKHCKRPFKNAEEMNETIIANWNAKVPKDAMIYILGDFTFSHETKRVRQFNSMLNGHKVLVYGNHDKVCKKIEEMGFHSKTYYAEDDIYDGTSFRKLIMFHYPMFSWNKQFHGSWHAYGHCHGTVINKMNAITPGTWDVGVDTNNFAPLSFSELAAKFKTTYPNGIPTKGFETRDYNRKK